MRRTLIDVFLLVKGQKAHPKHFSRQSKCDALYLETLFESFLRVILGGALAFGSIEDVEHSVASDFGSPWEASLPFLLFYKALC